MFSFFKLKGSSKRCTCGHDIYDHKPLYATGKQHYGACTATTCYGMYCALGDVCVCPKFTPM